MMPDAIPRAHMTPMMVSARCLAFMLMAAITMAAAREKPRVPSI
jgi:hypothetical protein